MVTYQFRPVGYELAHYCAVPGMSPAVPWLARAFPGTPTDPGLFFDADPVPPPGPGRPVIPYGCAGRALAAVSDKFPGPADTYIYVFPGVGVWLAAREGRR